MQSKILSSLLLAIVVIASVINILIPVRAVSASLLQATPGIKIGKN